MSVHHPSCEHQDEEVGAGECTCAVVNAREFAAIQAWAMRMERALQNIYGVGVDLLGCKECTICDDGKDGLKEAMAEAKEAVFSLISIDDCMSSVEDRCRYANAIEWARRGCAYWFNEECTAKDGGIGCVMYEPCRALDSYRYDGPDADDPDPDRERN